MGQMITRLLLLDSSYLGYLKKCYPALKLEVWATLITCQITCHIATSLAFAMSYFFSAILLCIFFFGKETLQFNCALLHTLNILNPSLKEIQIT